MLILLDTFAEMLDVEPAELLQSIRTGGEWEGLSLPAPHYLLGAMMMFDDTDVAAFVRRWQERAVSPPSDAACEPPVSLVAFATQAGIAPLALYQAVIAGRKLRGFRLAVPVSTVPSLMFEPGAVRHFVDAFRGRLKINR